MTNEPRGKHFDDFSVGDVFTTGKRTVTTTDIVNFSCLSGDFNEVHTNWEYCKESPFGEPIAHGPLVYAIAAGLGYASGLNEGTLIALLGVDDWKMLKSVKNGDTIHLEQEVVAVKAASKGGKGVVTFDRRIRNQHGDVVQQMTSAYLYHARPQN
ncbi:acyl dehydratase [Nocardioides marmoriginsengisoli]|uniref:Acyl dehydratase n=1 Tax=Nocardioides marmoriginsengisoli TaxID=661483 RepID=A0A3N0CIH5_9ACTN|nr:MaoC/PaaZ C-terminal domain-containing protein [Nocardioides marmoriginsengisoli]RNL62806.1 acyl dehydratase [Nocardioides marmoriginsengisoli]